MLESILSYLTMARKTKEGPDDKVHIGTNRKARHNYEILEVFEAGIELKGAEVKSLRERNVNFEGSFARADAGALELHNLHIGPYKHNSLEDIPPTRTRRLLMHRREIRKLESRLISKGLTLVPLELYFRRGWAKVALGLARGKQAPDKRQKLKSDAEARELARSFKGRIK